MKSPSDSLTKETLFCVHESYSERDHDHIKTGCGSSYFQDDMNNDSFVYCPYCGKEIDGPFNE